MQKHIIIGLFLLFATAVLASDFKVNPDTRFIIDKYGRSRIFHGVNAVYKLPPYYPPILDKFDAFNSLSDQDFQNLRSWGLDHVRLYMSWEGTEQVRGQYNATYMEIIKTIVQRAAKYNISIILDAHQDLGSRKFCGEGLPDWAVNYTDFPSPLPWKISYDKNGYANLTDCNKHAFAQFYTTNNVRSAFENFYNDVDGIAESFTEFWKAIADFFKDEPNIIGYELINEPPSFTTKFINIDANYLQPLYRRTHNKIRQVDNNTIIFFEPNVFDIISVGFTAGPGGEEYNDRQVFSYHIYCPDVNSEGEPITPALCETFDKNYLSVKAKKAEALGLAAFLTEFGALSNSQKSADEVARVTGLADENLHSWSYWQFKWYDDFTTAAKPGSTESLYNVDGTLQANKTKALARSYAPATCGVPTSQVFDPTSGNFTFSYKLSQNCQGQPTEIFLSNEYYYPKGFTYNITGCTGASLLGSNNYYTVSVPSSAAEGTPITITVTANK